MDFRNKLKFGLHADIINIKAEIVDEVDDLLEHFEMAVLSNNSS